MPYLPGIRGLLAEWCISPRVTTDGTVGALRLRLLGLRGRSSSCSGAFGGGGSGGAEGAKVGPGSAARAPGGERFLCPAPATPPFPLYSGGASAFQNPWLSPRVPCPPPPRGPTGQRPSLSVPVRWLRRPCLRLREALSERPLCPSPLRPFSAFPQGADTSWPGWQVVGGNRRSGCRASQFIKRFPQPPQSRARNHLHSFGR